MKKLEKGFTLIELMIVVAIIAILAAVAAPRFGTQIQKAQDAKGIQLVGTWRSAYQMYYADELSYATELGKAKKYVDEKALGATYKADGAAFADSTSEAAVVVGKSSKSATVTATGQTDIKGKAIAVFKIKSTSTTENSIVFDDDNGTDAKGTSWSAY